MISSANGKKKRLNLCCFLVIRIINSQVIVFQTVYSDKLTM